MQGVIPHPPSVVAYQESQSLSDLLQLSLYNDLDVKGVSNEIGQRQGAGACFLLDLYKWI